MLLLSLLKFDYSDTIANMLLRHVIQFDTIRYDTVLNVRILVSFQKLTGSQRHLPHKSISEK